MENELKLKFILIPWQFLQNEEVQKKGTHKAIYLFHPFPDFSRTLLWFPPISPWFSEKKISQVMLFFCSQKPTSWRWISCKQKTFGPEALHQRWRAPELWPYEKLMNNTI